MRSLQTLLGLILVLLASIPSEGFGQEPMRQWSSRGKNESVEASFQAYDAQTKQVSLQLQNGEWIQVDLRQLSRSDQRYVKSVARNKLDDAEATRSKVVAANENSQSRPLRKDSAKMATAYGIHWTPGIENALKIAAGQVSSADDDRPVMWLRVLGDLDGFM